jgi:hypothetical protein
MNRQRVGSIWTKSVEDLALSSEKELAYPPRSAARSEFHDQLLRIQRERTSDVMVEGIPKARGRFEQEVHDR